MGVLAQIRSPQSAGRGAAATSLLAVDDDTRVECLSQRGRRLVRKSHWLSGWAALRSFLRRSRAEREHRNLQALRAAGVAAVRARHWRDVRRFGCVRRCELWTDFWDGAVDLRGFLRAEADPAPRRACAVALGSLLRDLHAVGFVSSTASLRNVLRAPDGALALCDQPYLSRPRRAFVRSGRALDLYDAFLSRARRREWTRAERLRGLLAYTDGDRAAARRLFAEISRRSRPWSRAVRQLGRLAILHTRRPDRS